MKRFSEQTGSYSTEKSSMKLKIISSVLAFAVASSMLTGCGIFSPPSSGIEYSSGSSYSESDFLPEYSSEISDFTSSEDTAPQNPGNETSSSSSSTTYNDYAPDFTRSSESSSSDEPTDYSHQRPRFLDTKSEEFVAYTTGNRELNFSPYYTPYLFDFRTYMAVGFSLNDTNNQLSVEADYGIKGRFDGAYLTLQTYDYTGGQVYITGSYMEALDKSTDKRIEWPCYSEPKTDYAGNLPNGLYKIIVLYSNYTTVELYYLINGDEYSFCQVIQANDKTADCNHNINDIRDRRAVLKKLLAESTVTPENSLSVDIIKYPSIDYYDSSGRLCWRCDTDLWANLSDELVDPSWSKERKAYVICDWISQNFAYDIYVSDVLHKDRANHYCDNTGTYSTWKLRCGVCRDFGQIVAIMLRKQGIPTEVIANDNHLWNIVYINGRWIETDLCYSTTQYVNGEDTTARTDSYNDYFGLLSMVGQNNNRHYGTSLHRYLYMGQTEF